MLLMVGQIMPNILIRHFELRLSAKRSESKLQRFEVVLTTLSSREKHVTVLKSVQKIKTGLFHACSLIYTGGLNSCEGVHSALSGAF